MLERMFDLTGRIALVTGGNGGIGLGMARGIGQAGATVIVVGRNAEKSAAALRELQSLGVHPLWATALIYLFAVLCLLAQVVDQVKGLLLLRGAIHYNTGG